DVPARWHPQYPGARLLRHRRRVAQEPELPVLGFARASAHRRTGLLRVRVRTLAAGTPAPLGLREADQPEADAVRIPDEFLHRNVVLVRRGRRRSGNSLESCRVSPRTTVAVRALGPYGGSAPGYRLTTFLLDGETALDAGCLTDALPLSAQRRVKRVLLTHAHFDHIASLPLLCDNLYGQSRP